MISTGKDQCFQEALELPWALLSALPLPHLSICHTPMVCNRSCTTLGRDIIYSCIADWCIVTICMCRTSQKIATVQDSDGQTDQDSDAGRCDSPFPVISKQLFDGGRHINIIYHFIIHDKTIIVIRHVFIFFKLVQFLLLSFSL